ncbi:hypothetical protein [Stenotrophomonas maltophilia]|uniref:hypothetical protein n=1 Tax=Stenotrophomonas maltophilia TaxID=40324 RepID=UPI00021E0B0E|nr:hypothetical protein [Stenotrophomonas maltophilia]AEM51470.1 hypothetical protein BurJV3_2147 [Stenotrophomonas maltophilia JV3]
MSASGSTAWQLRQIAGLLSAQLFWHGAAAATGTLSDRQDQVINRVAQSGLRALPTLGSSRYRAADCHLQALGATPAAARAEAARHVALELLRNARFRRYEIRDPSVWRRRIHGMALSDPQQLWRASSPARMIALLHTGEYRLAVARAVELHNRPTRFLVPALCTEGDPMHRALKSLEQFGHSIEVVHPSTPNLALRMLRRLRSGTTVIAFIDMPAAIGHQRFADPVHCRFLGRDARMALAPLQLAAAAGCPVLLAGALMAPDSGGQLKLLHHAEDPKQPGSTQALLDAASAHIQSDPANWFLLDRLDSYLRVYKDARPLDA